MKKALGADQKDSTFLQKFLSGAIAGSIGSCAGSPFDMMKIRMMSYEGTEKRGLGSFMGEIYRS